MGSALCLLRFRVSRLRLRMRCGFRFSANILKRFFVFDIPLSPCCEVSGFKQKDNPRKEDFFSDLLGSLSSSGFQFEVKK